MKSILIALLLISPFASARMIDLACTVPSVDANGNPTVVQGMRFYADGSLIADEPGCVASADVAPGTYDFTVAAYNVHGEGAQSAPTRFTVTPEETVPAQPGRPTVTLAVAGAPPDREYFATTASRDSIHPDTPAGTRVRVWYLDGNVEVNSRGSTRADSVPYSVAWSQETPTGWSQPEQIIWN